MAPTPSDSTLLDRYATGREESAFAELVQRHRPRVRATCRRWLGPAAGADADDVVQATFLALARRAGDPSWRESVGGWLVVVARRLARDTRAATARRGRRERPLGAVEPASRRDDPAADGQRRELGRAVRDELRRLPEKYRAPVVLCDLEGLSHREAADRLGLPPGSISRRLGKARAILRQRLARHALGLAALAALLWRLGPEPPPPDRGLVEATRPRASAVGLPLADLDGRPRTPTTAEVLAWAAAYRDHGAGGPAEAAGALRLAAVDLGRAARTGPPTALLAAARRLDATCARCHLAARH